MSAKNCCFTLNNYTETEYADIQKWTTGYLIIAKEIGVGGTPHLQGYVEWTGSKRFSTMKNLNPRIHWEARKGTAQQAADYCKKDGNFIEVGTLSKQGARTDLTEVKNQIMKGKRVDDIVIENPNLYHQYGRTLSKIEDLAMRQKFRLERTQGIWYWGATGVGKSHLAFKDFHPDTHYVVPNDNGWWDGYTQQETVILNDFRGNIPYNEMLQMVDKWPYAVKRRGREPMPFTSKTVIITSSLPPDQIYKNRDAEDKIEQLLRRFRVEKIVAEVV